MKYEYTAFGLSLRSDVEIPGAVPGKPTGTLSPVELTAKRQPEWASEAEGLASAVIHSLPAEPECADPTFVVREFGGGTYFQLAYGDGTQFLIDSGGERVCATFVAPLTLEDLATYFLGPVMGFVLRRRGVTPLHASAVAIGKFAIAISGAAGTGKSTTAAALALRGAPAMCEDIAALDESAEGFCVRPGYPRVCLWPDSVEKLLGEGSSLPDLTPTWNKKFLPLDGVRAHFGNRPLPLGAIYLLGHRVCEKGAPRLEEVGAREALLELVQNTYMNALLTREQRAAEFELLSRLVTSVPSKRVIPHQDPTRIAALCELLEADAGHCTAERSVRTSEQAK